MITFFFVTRYFFFFIKDITTIETDGKRLKKKKNRLQDSAISYKTWQCIDRTFEKL